MPPKKYHVLLLALRPPKPPKAPQAWESYSQSFQATQYIHHRLSVVATQEAVVLIGGIKEAWPSSQIKIIEDKSGAIFKDHGKTVKKRQMR